MVLAVFEKLVPSQLQRTTFVVTGRLRGLTTSHSTLIDPDALQEIEVIIISISSGHMGGKHLSNPCCNNSLIAFFHTYIIK